MSFRHQAIGRQRNLTGRMSCVSYVVACLGIRTFDGNTREGGLETSRLLMTHGYMLSGTGSNVYVQNLCRALAGMGHDVHLLCQEPNPLSYDFVTGHYRASARGVEKLGGQAPLYAGSCHVYQPEIGDLLPVYVYDDYPGWCVKTFLGLSEWEFENYVSKNVAALRKVLDHSGATVAVTNHAVPGPEIARRALSGTGTAYASIIHGSSLQYVARQSGFYMQIARRGLSKATKVIALSYHSAGTVAEYFPELDKRTVALPGGVDTGRFRPDALDIRITSSLVGGPGRGTGDVERLHEILDRFSNRGSTEDLARELKAVSSRYEPRCHDADAGERLRSLISGDARVILYVGKLIHSKGVHCLFSAFARVRREEPETRLLIIGYGTLREGLEALALALSAGNRHVVELLARGGRLFEGGPASQVEYLSWDALARQIATLAGGYEKA